MSAMGIKEMINQRLAAAMQQIMRERAAAGSSASSLSSTIKKQPVADGTARVQERADATSSALLLVEPSIKELVTDRPLLEVDTLPLEGSRYLTRLEDIQAESLPEAIQGKQNAVRSRIPGERAHELYDQVQDKQLQDQQEYQQDQVRSQIQAEEQLAREPQVRKLVDGYAGLKSASKRKRVDQDPDPKPLRRRFTYNANGTRQLADRNVAEGEELTEKPEDLVVKKYSKDKKTKVSKNVLPKTKTHNKEAPTYVSQEVIHPGLHGEPKLDNIFDILTTIKACIVEPRTREHKLAVDNQLLTLRAQIQEMSLYNFVDSAFVQKSNVLGEDGLSQITDGLMKHKFPRDIFSDTQVLLSRLRSREVDGSLLRGVNMMNCKPCTGARKVSYSVKKEFEFRKEANMPGSNGLLNGQWWPLRICALRDGAHGILRAGIHGKLGKGAYSIVVGKDNRIFGTDSESSISTWHTRLLEEAFLLDQPLRVLRAVNPKSKHAPSKGIRFDGMYKITGKELLDFNTARLRFTLKRIEGQDPIRYQGVEVRPNAFELAEMERIEKLRARL